MLYFKDMDVMKNTKHFTLLLAVIFFVLSAFAYTNIAVAEPNGYATAKVELARLLEDKKRSEYRHNWLRISDTFNELYRNNANWNNRPAALFRAAKCLDEMARRSFVRKDAQSAAYTYEELAQKHPISPLADDSLYAAACIYHELLRETQKAKSLLNNIKRNYAKTDYYPKAMEYLAQIDGNVVASLGSTSMRSLPKQANISLNTITPQLKNDVVRIVLSMSSIASWRAKYFNGIEEGQQNLPGILITLKDVAPSEKLNLEDTFRKSGIFVGYNVEYDATTAQSTVLLQFSKLTRYTVKAEKEPARLIIEATNAKNALAGGIYVGASSTTQNKNTSTAQAPKKEPSKSSQSSGQKNSKEDMPTLQGNIAAQLGLKVSTIVIDPGHGGKDPGAQHNGVREKDINLDVAKRLRNVLKSAGYTVHLTRSDDRYLGLYERTDIARKYNADLFISIHANAHTKTSIHGFETYFLDFTKDPEASRIAAIENVGVERKGLGEMEKILGDMLLKSRIKESKRLASMVQTNSIRKAQKSGFALKDGGTRGAPFHVLIGSSMPCILIELGYTSNPIDAKRLKSEEYKNSIAEGIANGIHQYAQSLLANK